ncbi:glycosyltransferase family 61 protein [Microbacterium resistens]|uniref:Glycosyltransferase family 61 protein n=1 Tax=Microbacterium resistens TaxID=156977 RepID=A0ABY3RTU9_9MICO|nr:glycosyltransferase family 61 protein [Microbacterium resistens]UGS26390.1 glycosyltransferase family 61 protein [Microbacterium resistens]
MPLRKLSGSEAEWHGGVIDSEGNFVAGHIMKDGRMAAKRDVTSAYPPGEDVEVREEEETVIWGGGRPIDHFGHFLIEMLGRLWYRVENPHRALKVAFTVGDTPPSESFLKILHMTGLADEDMIFVDRPTRFRRVVVPDNSMYLNGVMHVAHTKSVFDKIRSAVTPMELGKIYLTRRQLPPSNVSLDVNEEMLEDFFVSHGYKVVAPEKFSFSDQVALMAGATEVACTLGTLSHLLAFSPDNVRASIFLRDKTTPVPVQWSLARMRNAQVSIVDCLAPLLPTRHNTGLHFFMHTREFDRFTSEQFGVPSAVSSYSAEPFALYSPDQLVSYLREWSTFMQSFPESRLPSLPKLTASNLIRAVSKYVSGVEASPDSLRRIERQYDQ